MEGKRIWLQAHRQTKPRQLPKPASRKPSGLPGRCAFRLRLAGRDGPSSKRKKTKETQRKKKFSLHRKTLINSPLVLSVVSFHEAEVRWLKVTDIDNFISSRLSTSGFLLLTLAAANVSRGRCRARGQTSASPTCGGCDECHPSSVMKTLENM